MSSRADRVEVYDDCAACHSLKMFSNFSNFDFLLLVVELLVIWRYRHLLSPFNPFDSSSPLATSHSLRQKQSLLPVASAAVRADFQHTYTRRSF